MIFIPSKQEMKYGKCETFVGQNYLQLLMVLPPLNSSLTPDEKKKIAMPKKAHHKTQPGHITTLMHLLTLVKAKEAWRVQYSRPSLAIT